MKSIIKVLFCVTIFFIPKVTFSQYHIDGPGTEACYEKIKQSKSYAEELAKYKLKPSDITMGYISMRDYDCYSKNILRCDGDIFIGKVTLTSAKDKDGVYYKGDCRVYYRRLNSYCNLQPTFTFDRVDMYPFVAYGKKPSVKDEVTAKILLKQALQNKELARTTLIGGDFGLIKIDNIKYNSLPSKCKMKGLDIKIIDKSEGTAVGGQKLVYSAKVYQALYNSNEDVIVEINKFNVLINLELDAKNTPIEIKMEELDCEGAENNSENSNVFKMTDRKPYDTLFTNYKKSGIEAVWEKTTQAPIPFSSKLFHLKLYKEISEQLKLLTEDKQKNREILTYYVDEKVLEQWLTSLEVATSKGLKIVLESSQDDLSFNFTFMNKKNVNKGTSSSFGFNGSEYSSEVGKFTRELNCQIIK